MVATLRLAALAPLRVNVIRVLELVMVGPLLTDNPALRPAVGIDGLLQVLEPARTKVQLTVPEPPSVQVELLVFQFELLRWAMMELPS